MLNKKLLVSVVRDSRMWCPHDIGRDSWVWGEQETLYMMNSPHEVGEEALFGRISPLGRKRGVPWVRWLLNPIISLRIIIVEPGGPRPVAKVVCSCVYGDIVSPVCKENEYVASGVFCCC